MAYFKSMVTMMMRKWMIRKFMAVRTMEIMRRLDMTIALKVFITSSYHLDKSKKIAS